MKRINPKTNSPFKHGDVREDGRVFHTYRTNIPVKKNGFYVERWLKNSDFELYAQKNRANTKKWHQENYEKVKEKSKKYYAENVESLKAKSQKWRKENPDKVKAATKKWQQQNTDKLNANQAKRRASKLQATPNWLTEKHFEQINELYTIAKMFQMYTGQKYHVDHEIPLQGEDVRGLHVPWNMTVLLAKENIAKKNQHVL